MDRNETCYIEAQVKENQKELTSQLVMSGIEENFQNLETLVSKLLTQSIDTFRKEKLYEMLIHQKHY